jgi:hypothetical protein
MCAAVGEHDSTAGLITTNTRPPPGVSSLRGWLSEPWAAGGWVVLPFGSVDLRHQRDYPNGANDRRVTSPYGWSG